MRDGGADVVGVDELAVDPVTAARRILGRDLVLAAEAGTVRLRIVEVEAYGGPSTGRHPDPAAHSFPGPTARNAVMFGRAGRLYVYRSYGIHLCVNISVESEGEGGAVLLRAAEVDPGHELVADRRTRPDAVTPDPVRWAMGPGNLGAAAGVTLADNGVDVCAPGSRIRLEHGRGTASDERVESGPRVGLTVATGRPWRFWLAGSPAVSAFRPGSAAVRRRREELAARRVAAGATDAQGSDW